MPVQDKLNAVSEASLYKNAWECRIKLGLSEWLSSLPSSDNRVRCAAIPKPDPPLATREFPKPTGRFFHSGKGKYNEIN